MSHRGQLDLLRDWVPPAVTERFDEQKIRASTIAGRICRAISESLRDKGPRENVVRRMSDFCGQEISKNMLDAYASQAREDHAISLVRFMALIHATRDRRLLEIIAEQFGWAVVERRHLPMIELAQVQERLDDLRRHADALKRQTRSGTQG